jgi:hypothetical protein
MFSAKSSAADFVVVRSSLLSNTSMSYTAKGVLLTCLSSTKSFTKNWIASHGSEDAKVISEALRELLSLGYLKKFSENGEAFYVFTDLPDLADQLIPQAPRRRSSRPSAPAEPIALEPWLEPHRELLERWLARRLKAHPSLEWEITSRSITALRYARDQKVIAELCELAAEKSWQSLGFAGYKDTVDKLAKEKHGKSFKPAMSEISYTLK